uniref:Chondroitin sulfate proteoglycan 4ba n=1 Tax=Gasterosteus aculeatus aculeatus TaxID=481459 RepID=G3NL98_GASAC
MPLSPASFYGDGFVQLKAAESSDRNTLRVRFRTSSAGGLLFLAAGQTHYFLLELHAGRLQLKLDLGPGEVVLRSEKGTQLNDLAWHSVEVHHVLSTVTLTVDKNSHTDKKMAGYNHNHQIFEWLYVGGSGGLDRLYLPRDVISFRGCMDEVVFNEHDLLSSLRPYTGFNVHEVSLGCSPQFSATEEDPISFFSSRAYISLPTWNVQHEATFEGVVHTSAKEGIILYTSAREGDFVAVEIQEGLPVAIVGKGGTKTELRSLTFINDRKWHSMKLHFTSKSLELTVDGEMVKSSISSGSKGLQLRGYLFVGGIDDGTRAEVRKVGLASVSGKRVRGGSFKGCLKNIEVNGVTTGLSNAVVSKDISVGCELEKKTEPSTTSSPTSAPVHYLHSPTPTPPLQMSTLAIGLDRKYGSNFVQLKNLVVQEGSRASLEAKHIKVVLDFKKLGIRQSQIMFQIREQPIHGQIRLDVDPDQEENTFSMLDLWHGRVMYIHGGSEEPDDFFMFSMYSSSRKKVPDYLRSNKLYRYNITVTPTNDAPELSLPEGNLFVLLENSKKRLTTDVLKATDIDSNYTDLVFSVLGNLNADAGYLEIENNPGEAVTAFSYLDLEELRVFYAHAGVRNSRIVLRVSDGEKVSNTVVLRVMAVALEYKIANNTGLEIIQGETAILGSKQLAVQTNAVKQVVDIRYDIIEAPQYGELQRLHSSGEWRPTDSFSQRLLEKERLRYVSTYQEIQTTNATDYFKSRVIVAARETTEILFSITVKWVNYHLVRNVVIDMDKVRKATLDSECLLATVDGVALSEEDIHYRVLTTPKKGKLLLKATVLGKNSTFSQKDLTDKKVHYDLVDRPYEDTSDRFKFQLVSKHAQSQYYDFRFSIKADVNSVFMRNDGLSVQEGGSKLITKDNLFAETLSTKDMYYTIISTPKHGKLARISQSNSNASYDNILTFSNQDVLEERIMYIHDDSETTQDEFTFIASTSQGFKSSITLDDIGSKEGVFNITIRLFNDQKPVRIIDKVFHVVRDGRKILTIEDLRYHDADSDFDDGQLIYTRRGIPMGDLVLVNDTAHRLFQFRQKDLEDKRVLFIHKGVSTGRFVLFVSDGQHFVSSLLDISAHDPFLRVGNNTGLLVQKGRSVTFSTSNFSVVSNLDIRDDQEVMFILDGPPKYGALYRNETKVQSFSQSDFKDGLVSYRHNDSRHLADSFNLTVSAKGQQLAVRINVKVYLEMCVLGSLQVTHEDNLPSEIAFTVKVAPSHGFLRRYVEAEERYIGTQHSPVNTFTQEDVNSGNIQYVQTEPERVNDTFVLDATNGVTEVAGITMSVDIIPRLIPLQVSNFTLNEGASKALTQDVLKVTNRLYRAVLWFLYIFMYVYHGDIRYHLQLSETSADCFTVTANDTGLRKQSAPQTVHIQVTAVNDEPPVITANRVLRVWVSSMTEIRPEDLRAQDMDTPPAELHFMVTPPSNGYLALKTDPMRAVLNFTQQHVDQGQLLFVHKGAMSGGFSFQANDGLNFSPRQIFSITARALVLSLEKNRPLKVFPGKSPTGVIIDESKLDATNLMSKLPMLQRSSHEVWFQVTSLPQHGVIVVGERNLTKEKPNFSQFIVNKYGITYKHDNSETTCDSFSFSAWLNPRGKTAQRPQDVIDVVEERFNITITPVNDQMPLLKTKSPSLGVVQGDTVALGPENLKVEDLDNPPEDIKFSVISKPNNGYLALEGSLDESIVAFTQAQINNGSVYFIHDGSSVSGVFYFSVTDGHHKPIYKLFNLEVTEITISLVNYTKLSLLQGKTSVSLTQDNLAAETNGKNITIRYQITRPPNFGKLLKDNQEATEFEQEDLCAGRLSYHMISLTSAEDSFEFTAFTSEASVSGQIFNITVRPLIQVGKGLRIPNGIAVKLNTSFLNASDLANISDSDPVFEMISQPKYGRVVWTKPKMSRKNVAVETFTFQDLMQERVALDLNANMTGVQELNDSLAFVLKAQNIQPAKGEFHFKVVPYDRGLVPTPKSPVPTSSSSHTPVQTSRSGSASPVLSTGFFSTQQPSKNQQKFKARNRWGSSNRTSVFSTTLGKPTRGTEDFPFRNTPVRVESYPQKTTSPLLVILPLLALLLLIIIFVVLVVFLRHHRQSKQNATEPKEPPPAGFASGPSYQGQPQRCTTVPTVTVTPLNPSCPGSPVLDRLLSQNQASIYDTIDSNMLISTWRNGSPSPSSQIIRTATPTLQTNQYWV